jgi:hypothetical protein
MCIIVERYMIFYLSDNILLKCFWVGKIGMRKMTSLKVGKLEE